MALQRWQNEYLEQELMVKESGSVFTGVQFGRKSRLGLMLNESALLSFSLLAFQNKSFQRLLESSILPFCTLNDQLKKNFEYLDL